MNNNRTTTQSMLPASASNNRRPQMHNVPPLNTQLVQNQRQNEERKVDRNNMEHRMEETKVPVAVIRAQAQADQTRQLLLEQVGENKTEMIFANQNDNSENYSQSFSGHFNRIEQINQESQSFLSPGLGIFRTAMSFEEEVTSYDSILRPFRSVSPVKTFALLRDLEKLKPRSESCFIDPYERERSSSEESSMMYQRFKAQKFAKIKQQQEAAKRQQAMQQKAAATASNMGKSSTPGQQQLSNPSRAIQTSDKDGASAKLSTISALASPTALEQSKADVSVTAIPPPNLDARIDANQCNAPLYNERNEKLEESMTEERLEAEKRGFDYLSRLVKSFRKDAHEVSEQIRASIEVRHPKKRPNQRNAANYQVKETCVHIFAVSKEEYRRNQENFRGKRNSQPIVQKSRDRSDTRKELSKPPIQRPSTFHAKASARDNQSAKRQTLPLTRDPITVSRLKPGPTNAWANGTFRIPVQKCEKAESNQSSPSEMIPQRRATNQESMDKQSRRDHQPAEPQEKRERSGVEHHSQYTKEQWLHYNPSKPGGEHDGPRPQSEMQHKGQTGTIMKLQTCQSNSGSVSSLDQAAKNQLLNLSPESSGVHMSKAKQQKLVNMSAHSPSPRGSPSITAESPDRDGGLTERTHHKKDKSLRFDLHECQHLTASSQQQQRSKCPTCDQRVAGSFQQMHSHHQHGYSRGYMDQAFCPNEERHYWLAHAQSQEAKSISCATDNCSEHYIRAKKFAAHKKRQQSFRKQIDVGSSSEYSKQNKRESPPAQINSLKHLTTAQQAMKQSEETTRGMNKPGSNAEATTPVARTAGATIRVSKTDSKVGSNYFSYEATTEKPVASQFQPLSTSYQFSPKPGDRKQIVKQQTSLAIRRHLNIKSSHNDSPPPEISTMTKSKSDNMHVRKSLDRRPTLQQSQKGGQKHNQLVYKMTPHELSKMSNNLSNFASLFDEGDTTHGDISVGHSNYQQIKSLYKVSKGPQSYYNKPNSPVLSVKKFNSKLSNGHNDRPPTGKTRPILKNKSDFDSSNDLLHNRQRSGSGAHKQKRQTMAIKSNHIFQQKSEITPQSGSKLEKSDGRDGESIITRQISWQKETESLMEPGILGKPTIITAYSPEFPHQNANQQRLDYRVIKESQLTQNNARAKAKAHLVNEFLENPISSYQLSSEYYGERSPHVFKSSNYGSAVNDQMISSRAVRFPSPHGGHGVGQTAYEIYEPYLNYQLNPPSRQEEEMKSGSGPSNLQSHSPHLLTSNSSQYEKLMHNPQYEEQKSLILHQQLLINRMQHEYESQEQQAVAKTYSSLVLPSGESDEAFSNPLGSGRGKAIHARDRAANAIGHLSPQNFTDNRQQPWLSPSTAPNSCLTGRVEMNQHPRSLRNDSVHAKQQGKTSGRSRQLEQKSDSFKEFKLRIQHTEQLSPKGASPQQVSESNVVEEENRHHKIRKPQVQIKLNQMPSKYSEVHGGRSKDQVHGYQAPFMHASLPGNRPFAIGGQKEDDSSSSSSSSEECNVSQNTISPPRRSQANPQHSGPDLYKLTHGMRQQMQEEYDPSQKAFYPHNNVTHSLITSTVKQNPQAISFSKALSLPLDKIQQHQEAANERQSMDIGQSGQPLHMKYSKSVRKEHRRKTKPGEWFKNWIDN